MAITLAAQSNTISTTEFSLPANANYVAGSPQTDDCVLQPWIDFVNMVAGDSYRIKVYDKVTSGGTQRPVYEAVVTGAQAHHFVLPTLIVGEAWDCTVQRLSGADRVIGWSLRKVA